MARSPKKVPKNGTPVRRRGPPAGPDRMNVFDALKQLLWARGATYADLARAMRMSESGVKKIFASEDCSLARLEEIAHTVGFTLRELFDAAARPPIEHVELT